MALNEHVRITRRFLRSICIDSDLGDAAALEGFVCPQSSADILGTMVRHVSETGQGAFTWTGPYGSGKSSLVVALSALLNGNAGLQEEAVKSSEQSWQRLSITHCRQEQRDGVSFPLSHGVIIPSLLSVKPQSKTDSLHDDRTEAGPKTI